MGTIGDKYWHLFDSLTNHHVVCVVLTSPNALCFIMVYLVAMEICVTLFLLVQFCICYIA